MKLWLILYVTNGVVGGSWGPLPYDMTECLKRADEGRAMFKANEKTKDWEPVCEYRVTRPNLGDKR